MEVKQNVKYVLSSNGNNQLGKFYHDLNEWLITATNTLVDGS